MKTFPALALLAASLLLAFSVMAPAQAALIHNLTTSFRFGSFGSGQITFNNDNGGTDVNDVAAFSFDVVAGEPGGPQSYGITDIATIDWSIGTDWSLSINLVTNLIPFGPDLSALTLINDGVNVPLPCFPAVSVSIATTCLRIGSSSQHQDADLLTEAVHVPEPPTSLLFAVGVVSLFWLRRRRRSPCRRRLLGDVV